MLEKIKISGIVVLAIGVGLLLFTFINAYLFLHEDLGIIATKDLVEAFGEALAPLIATCIRIMYLGVMGWIGSILTMRGITLIRHPPPPKAAQEVEPKTKPATQQQAKRAPKKVAQPQEKPKEAKTKEEKQKTAQSSEGATVRPPLPPPPPPPEP
ncbi:MAG: hypothetical protein U9O89_08085 [Thermoproteota archaeon]|nr:hypothetical protein [Thermoproteota archaeon]